jgi:hypothetical protein
METWSKYKKNKYKKWKSSIESGEFIMINDIEYEEFSKIHNNEVNFCDISDTSSNDHCISTVDITENQPNNDENNILENKRSQCVKNITYNFCCLALFVIAGITFNYNYYYNNDSYSQSTKISNNYRENDLEWLIL